MKPRPNHGAVDLAPPPPSPTSGESPVSRPNARSSTGGSPVESAYDQFAEIYDRWMAADFCRRALPVIGPLLLDRLPPGARVLDLCCGSGQMARALIARGFRVTGIDCSEPMLRLAAANAPAAELICADARDFAGQGPRQAAGLRVLGWNRRFAAALSTFNSLAHMATASDLEKVFRNVRRVLEPRAPFLFDLSMEEAYTAKWRGAFALVGEDHACILRPSYDSLRQVGQNRVTVFCRQPNAACWRRLDFKIEQKCHPKAAIDAALRRAGFCTVESFDAEQDLNMAEEYGRRFFLCA